MAEQVLQEQARGEVAANSPAVEHRAHFYRPSADVLEFADHYRVYLDLPGAQPEGVDVRFQDGTLTVLGKVAGRQEPNTRYLVREYGVADFHRAFQVGDRIDAARIEAELNDGVLALHLPKVAAAQPRKIEVRGG